MNGLLIDHLDELGLELSMRDRDWKNQDQQMEARACRRRVGDAIVDAFGKTGELAGLKGRSMRELSSAERAAVTTVEGRLRAVAAEKSDLELATAFFEARVKGLNADEARWVAEKTAIASPYIFKEWCRLTRIKAAQGPQAAHGAHRAAKHIESPTDERRRSVLEVAKENAARLMNAGRRNRKD